MSRLTMAWRLGRAVIARPFGSAVLVALVAVAVYANTLGHELVYDDKTQIAENPFLTSPSEVGRLFTTSVWQFQEAPGRPVISNYYRPLFLLPIAVVIWGFGVAALPLHLLAVAVHAAVSVLVLVLARRALSSDWAATAAALLFAVHPIHAESVAWVSGLTDPLCALFVVSAWLLHDRRREEPKAGEAASGGRAIRAHFLGRDLAAAAMVAGALLAKETGAAVLLLLGIRDLTLGGPSELLRRWRGWALYLTVLGGYLAARIHALGGFAPQVRREELSTGELLLNLPPLFFDYLRYSVWPVGLNAFHLFSPIEGLEDPRLWFGLVALTAVLAFAVVAVRRRCSGALLLVVAFVAFLLPVLAIRSVGENTLAERYLYLPTIPLCLAAGWAFGRLARWRLVPAIAVLGVTVAVAAAATLDRNRVWNDDVTLYRDTLERSPGAFLIRANLGVELLDRGDLEGAIEELRTVIREEPRLGWARTHLGIAYHRQYRYRAAGEAYREALRLDPGDRKARFNLAHVECELGRPRVGLEHYAELAAIDPNYPDLAFARAVARREAGDAQRARVELAILALQAPSAAVHLELGRAAAAAGDLEGARRAYSDALELAPGSRALRAARERPEDLGLFDRLEAARLLAAAARFGERGELAAVVELAGYAAARDPRSALPYQQLANAAFLQGDRGTAVAALREAIARDPDNDLYRRNLDAMRATTR